MPNPGEVITVHESNGGLNWTNYTEPDPVCFKKAKDLPVINQEEVDKTKPLVVREADINGDGIPDQFRIVETKDYFLAFLYRGVNYVNTWENCGGGFNTYNGPEPKGQLVGAIAKDSKLQRKITKVDWQKAAPDEKNPGRFIVLGMEVYNNKTKETRWDFVFIPCAKSLPPSFHEGSEGRGCLF